jgi:thymidylate synthase ThyX
MEVARYVLPVATFAYLYHTVSALTLLRYARLAGQYDVPAEQRAVVGAMLEEVLRLDPEYARILEDPIPLEETPEHALLASHLEEGSRSTRAAFREEFDGSLEGRTSKMVGRKAENEGLLADSVREVLGRTRAEMNDGEAIALALDPSRNPVLGESLNLTTHAKLSRCLFHPGYTFRKKLSHSADSQDQRHRMTPASRPVLAAQLSWREPDYVVPVLVRHDEEAEHLYRESMERTWEAIDRLAVLGVTEEHAAYLLPNAVSVRFTESSDLLNLHHKMAMRLCYNAQEEIWRASVDEASQILEAEPRIGRHLLPPCTLRMEAGIRPWCPEGTRYCGVPVWNLSLGEYDRTL